MFTGIGLVLGLARLAIDRGAKQIAPGDNADARGKSRQRLKM